MSRRAAIVGAVSLALVAGTSAAAWAAWTAGGSGAAGAKAKTLGVATSVGAAATGTSSVRVSWSAPTSSSAPPATYVVRRTAPTAATVCTVAATTTQCDDTGLSASTAYSYTVEARLGTYWTSGQTSVVSATTNAVFTATALTLANGTGTAGRIDTGDTITVRFSHALDTTTVCAGWDGTGSKSVVVTVTQATPNDELRFGAGSGACNGTVAIGVVDLGNSGWVTSNQAFPATMTWSAATKDLTVTLGTRSGASISASGDFTASFTPDTGLRNTAGTAIDATQRPTDASVTGKNSKQLF